MAVTSHSFFHLSDKCDCFEFLQKLTRKCWAQIKVDDQTDHASVLTDGKRFIPSPDIITCIDERKIFRVVEKHIQYGNDLLTARVYYIDSGLVPLYHVARIPYESGVGEQFAEIEKNIINSYPKPIKGGDYMDWIYTQN